MSSILQSEHAVKNMTFNLFKANGTVVHEHISHESVSMMFLKQPISTIPHSLGTRFGSLNTPISNYRLSKYENKTICIMVSKCFCLDTGTSLETFIFGVYNNGQY